MPNTVPTASHVLDSIQKEIEDKIRNQKWRAASFEKQIAAGDLDEEKGNKFIWAIDLVVEGLEDALASVRVFTDYEPEDTTPRESVLAQTGPRLYEGARWGSQVQV